MFYAPFALSRPNVLKSRYLPKCTKMTFNRFSLVYCKVKREKGEEPAVGSPHASAFRSVQNLPSLSAFYWLYAKNNNKIKKNWSYEQTSQLHGRSCWTLNPEVFATLFNSWGCVVVAVVAGVLFPLLVAPPPPLTGLSLRCSPLVCACVCVRVCTLRAFQCV